MASIFLTKLTNTEITDNQSLYDYADSLKDILIKLSEEIQMVRAGLSIGLKALPSADELSPGARAHFVTDPLNTIEGLIKEAASTAPIVKTRFRTHFKNEINAAKKKAKSHFTVTAE